MGSTDIVLRWGEGNALALVEGVVEVDDLSAGETRLIYVDHSATQEFSRWMPPTFSLTEGDVAGLTLRVVDRGIVGATARRTDGDGFLLEVSVAADASGDDKSRGDIGWDWNINWERRGVTA